jgi:hypothetical protein
MMFRKFLYWSTLAASIATFPPAALAALSGTLTDAGTSLPLANASVRLTQFAFPIPIEVGSTTTDAAGHYSLGNGDGSYTIQFTRAGHLPETHSISVSGATVFDRALSMPARIRGFVRDGTNTPIADAHVQIEWIDRPSSMQLGGSALGITGNDGSYEVTDRYAGTYRLCVVNGSDAFRDVCYDQRLQPIGAVGDFTPLTLPSGGIANGVDFALPPGASIGGVLTDTYRNAPIANGEAAFWIHDTAGTLLASGAVATDATGHYAIGGLPGGTYALVFGGTSARFYSTRVYGGATCDPSCSFATATPVVVPTDASVTGVDMALHPGVVVGGRVTGEEGEPLPGIDVVACNAAFGVIYFEASRATSDANGYYEMAHVRHGQTRIGTVNSMRRIDQNWPAIARPPHESACWLAGSEFTTVIDEERLATNFTLAQGASVTGHVSDLLTGAPLQAAVEIRDDQSRRVWQGISAPDGNYVSTGLPNGTYYAHAYHGAALSPCQLFQAIDCGSASAPPLGGATPLTLVVPLVRSGVDFIYDIDKLFADGFQ